MEENQAKKVNWFVRITLIIFILYLLLIITAGFIMGTPSYNLTAEYIILFILIAVLILSESFDNLSMGSYLSLSREVKQKKEEVQEVKQENSELREHIIRMTTLINQNQHQSNTTINGLTPELLKMLGVTNAKKEEVEEEKKSFKNEVNVAAHASNDLEGTLIVNDATQRRYHKRDFLKFAEKESVDKYLEKHFIPEGNIIREVQFTPAFQGLDPIMERKIIFDAYLKLEQKELFFEILTNFTPNTLDRVYVQLSKINFYSQAKQVKAQLVLLLAELPEEIEGVNNQRFYKSERIIEFFQPAILNEFLKVETISFSLEDIERWKQEISN